MRPRPRARIPGSSARVRRIGAARLIASNSSTRSGGMSANGPSYPTPALFTSTSASPAQPATRSGSPGSARSAASHSTPGASSASVFRAASSRPVALTRAPRREKASAAARPIPLDAPVTSTTAPCTRMGRRLPRTGPVGHPGHVLPVRSIVVDFDGTISVDDVSDGLFAAFAEPGWKEIDLEFERGDIGSRECIERQMALLRGSPQDLETYAVEHFPVDPTFRPFVEWAREAGIDVTVASDGVGLHVLPLLESVGLGDLPVVTNRAVSDGRWRMEFPNGHERCVRCGTCKMNATLRARERVGPTAFVGDGHSDAFGALFADVVFAKRFLAEHCREEGIPFLEWNTFDDVRAALENGLEV